MFTLKDTDAITSYHKKCRLEKCQDSKCDKLYTNNRLIKYIKSKTENPCDHLDHFLP